jgi:hypothetical protein
MLTQYIDRSIFNLEANTFLKNKELSGLTIHRVIIVNFRFIITQALKSMKAVSFGRL